MKLFSLSFLATISAASASSLRGDFETDVADGSNRILQDCVAFSSYLGCYKDRNKDRALPFQVDGRSHTAAECEAACTMEGYTHFARQWKGQCFCTNEPTYDKHGEADECDCCGDNVGPRKMCVWVAGAAPGCDDGPSGATYLGCFKNKNKDRALPYKVDGQFHSANDCHDECNKKGMTYFAREWKGQCFCSEDADYSRHGIVEDCDCCADNVGTHKMCVWSA